MPYQRRLLLWFAASILALATAVALVLPNWPAHAQEESPPITLRVGTKELPPFVFVQDEALSGFSIELWEAIATDLGVEYEYVVVDTIDELLGLVRLGQVDLAISGISITRAREEVLDFSFPYFNSGLKIMVPVTNFSLLDAAVVTLLSGSTWRIVAGLVLVLLLAAHIVWLVERHENPDFHPSYLRGIWDALWWSAVTITTVGYGDKTPRGHLGRVVALVWMFASLFIISYFTASITSTITVQQLLTTNIETLNDLRGERLATVANSTADILLTERGFAPIRTDTIEEAYPLLYTSDPAQKVQAIVYDAPVLHYYATQQAPGQAYVLEQWLTREPYGIALPSGSPWLADIDLSLLNILENGTYNRLHLRYFGTEYELMD